MTSKWHALSSIWSRLDVLGVVSMVSSSAKCTYIYFVVWNMCTETWYKLYFCEFLRDAASSGHQKCHNVFESVTVGKQQDQISSSVCVLQYIISLYSSPRHKNDSFHLTGSIFRPNAARIASAATADIRSSA